MFKNFFKQPAEPEWTDEQRAEVVARLNHLIKAIGDSAHDKKSATEDANRCKPLRARKSVFRSFRVNLHLHRSSYMKRGYYEASDMGQM
jgi:hypothetical protein